LNAIFPSRTSLGARQWRRLPADFCCEILLRGEVKLEQVWPKPVDVKAIRKRVRMPQAEFSRAYGFSKRALQEWEQGGRQPDSAARAYLTVIAKEPAVVRRAVASE
jgi:DNA-binding XRE family transcriptional regulator